MVSLATERVCSSLLPVFDNIRCHYGGVREENESVVPPVESKRRTRRQHCRWQDGLLLARGSSTRVDGKGKGGVSATIRQ